MKNEQGRTVPQPYKDNAYEVWSTLDGSWKWYVLKKYQAPDKEYENPNARWFTLVESPYVPEGELGDTYIKDIKSNAIRIK